MRWNVSIVLLPNDQMCKRRVNWSVCRETSSVWVRMIGGFRLMGRGRYVT